MSCGTPLLTREEIQRRGLLRLKGEKRLRAISEASSKVSACRAEFQGVFCRTPVNVYYMGKPDERGNFLRYHAKGENIPVERMAQLSPKLIRDAFAEIIPSDAELLGFANGVRPEYMILENILVLPPSVRPPRVVGDKITHNDLTHLYSEIVATVNLISKAPSVLKENDGVAHLFNLVSWLFDNSKGRYHYSNSRAHRTIKEWITGKGRLIRGYTLGKRTDFYGRAPASPNPLLRLNQVGIPKWMAESLLTPEIVTEENRERLQRYYEEGKVVYLIKARGQFHGKIWNANTSLESSHEALRVLEVGDRVERHLMGEREEDGVLIPADVVLVNRQPTLHKGSMMGFSVVVHNTETIQLSVNACMPFGLDFDGDECNIHVATVEGAREELRGRMFVSSCIMSAQSNRPVIGLNQDAVTASYLITRDKVFISRAQAQQIITQAQLEDRLPSLLRRVQKYRTKYSSPIEERKSGATRIRYLDLYASSSEPSPDQMRRKEQLERRAHRILNERDLLPQFLQERNLTTPLTPTQQEQFQEWLLDYFCQSEAPNPLDCPTLTSPNAPRAQRERFLSLYNEWISEDTQQHSTQEVEQVVLSLIRQEVEEEYYLTGKELYSILFPEDYYYSKKNSADPNQPVVKIEEGIITQGTLNKNIIGAVANSVIHDLYKMYSPQHAEDFITRAKWLTDPWLASQGFSVSLADCLPQTPIQGEIDTLIRQAKADVWALGGRADNPYEEIRRQEMIRRTMCNAQSRANVLAMKSINPDNTINAMIASKSKGDVGKFASILTMVGEQQFQGQPIKQLAGGVSLPCFPRNTRDPSATGFITSSYIQGLTPSEFFYHQVAAREGLLGSAVKTSKTGYMERRVVKALEDAVAYPDGTVRSSSGNILQYAYGEDGFAGEKLVLTGDSPSFIDIDRLVDLIQNRRRAGLPEQFGEYVSERPQYVMPSFTEERIERLEEDEEGEEEEGEEEDASDLELEEGDEED